MLGRLTLPLLAAALAAQDGEGELLAVMKHLSQAVTTLQKAVAAHDRAAYPAPLDTLAEQVRGLRATNLPLAGARETGVWLLQLQEAIDDLRQPVADGSASDEWDLGRLRGACTGCHVQYRSHNDTRGLFPNRGNVVTGTLRLEEQDGTAREDRSAVVVFLEGPELRSPPLPRSPVLSQKGRSFHPPVLVVTAGTTVVFPNDDLVFHNVFSLSRSNPFDLGTYGAGSRQQHVFANPGLVKVHCNIHPDMAAHVLVLASSFAAVTSASGFWMIPDVPDGEYTLRVWHPLGDGQQQTVRVADGAALEVALTVRETRPRVQHTDKNGRPYPVKY
ncbi:MAG TPA: hypothetical protein VFZ65_12905 [Planctomycetota bacterium]|nr:hypothetical protein [Planctomycetota bacterium]